MNSLPQLREFYQLFFISTGASVFCGVLAYLQICRRHLWLRFLDAEERFWSRFGLPKGGSARRFSESRFFTVATVGLGLTFLFVALSTIAAFSHFRHQLPVALR